MREIEIKARVKNLATLQKKLEEQGAVFAPSVSQKDEVYAPAQIADDNTKNC